MSRGDCTMSKNENDESEACPMEGEASTPEAYPLGFVKAFYFIAFCYNASFLRFLTLYFENDGLGADQIGMLWAGWRVCGTLSAPLWAALADKTKRARTIVQISTLVSVFPFLCLALPLSDSSAKMLVRAVTLWIFGLCSAPAMNLRDALAIAASGGDSDRWGQARVYGAIGWGLMHFLMGPLLDWLGFAVAFIAFVVFSCLSFLVTRSSVPEACGQVRKEVTARAVLDVFAKNRLFFVNMGAIGAGFSMVEGMLFLLLQELKASTMLCGLSVVVTVIFELPIFHYAKLLLRKLGARRMILLGQLAWVVRAVFYANMSTAWTVLLIEPLHGVTFALVWTAATQHVADPAVSGQGLEASAQGLLTTCFMGIGPILGLAIGGFLFENLGSHAVYGVFAVVVLAVGLAYMWWGDQRAEGFSSMRDDTEQETIGRQMSLNDCDAIINGEITPGASEKPKPVTSPVIKAMESQPEDDAGER